MYLIRGASTALLINVAVILIGCLSKVTHAQVEYELVTPKDQSWLAAVNMSSVPDIPIRPIGSGQCDEKECDTVTTDRCFESCGNMPVPGDIFGCPRDHHWALTFDDGPSNYTLELLDYLDKEQIKATFCIMGAHAEEYPDVVKRIYKEGHQIASHTYSHPHLMSLSNEEIIYEIVATEKAIEKILGIRPTYIRPPFGEADVRVKGIMRAMGYKVLLWNVDPTDYDVYMMKDVSSVIQSTFKMAINGEDTGLNLLEDPGFISLQHDLYKSSIDQIPEIVQLLKSKGYSFFTAAGCNSDKNPHVVTIPTIADEFGLDEDSAIIPEPAMPEAPPKAEPQQKISEDDALIAAQGSDQTTNNDQTTNDQTTNDDQTTNNDQPTSDGLKTFSSPKSYIFGFISFLLSTSLLV